MKKLILLAAAAALFAPVMTSAASAETDVNVRIGTGAYPAYRAQQRVVVSSPHCRTVTVRTKRPNGSVMIRKVRRCG